MIENNNSQNTKVATDASKLTEVYFIDTYLLQREWSSEKINHIWALWKGKAKSVKSL